LEKVSKYGREDYDGQGTDSRSKNDVVYRTPGRFLSTGGGLKVARLIKKTKKKEGKKLKGAPTTSSHNEKVELRQSDS